MSLNDSSASFHKILCSLSPLLEGVQLHGCEREAMFFCRNRSGKQGKGRYKDGKAARRDIASVIQADHGSV